MTEKNIYIIKDMLQSIAHDVQCIKIKLKDNKKTLTTIYSKYVKQILVVT
jgi:hypothetical protein